MAATEMVHVRIDKRIKAQAAKTLGRDGLVCFRRGARLADSSGGGKVPALRSENSERRDRRSHAGSAQGRPSRPFNSVSDLMADLNAED